MPYKYETEKMLIPPKKDKRIKLTDEQRREIQESYRTGGYTMTQLGEEYGVSRYLISYIVNPERYEKAKEDYRERRKDGRYYKKDKHAIAIRKHRRHKYELYKTNKLIQQKKVNIKQVK